MEPIEINSWADVADVCIAGLQNGGDELKQACADSVKQMGHLLDLGNAEVPKETGPGSVEGEEK